MLNLDSSLHKPPWRPSSVTICDEVISISASHQKKKMKHFLSVRDGKIVIQFSFPPAWKTAIHFILDSLSPLFLISSLSRMLLVGSSQDPTKRSYHTCFSSPIVASEVQNQFQDPPVWLHGLHGLARSYILQKTWRTAAQDHFKKITKECGSLTWGLSQDLCPILNSYDLTFKKKYEL